MHRHRANILTSFNCNACVSASARKNECTLQKSERQAMEFETPQPGPGAYTLRKDLAEEYVDGLWLRAGAHIEFDAASNALNVVAR
jgi:hypothetical protein